MNLVVGRNLTACPPFVFPPPHSTMPSISVGFCHTVVVPHNGSVHCWGSNNFGCSNFGQCDVPTDLGRTGRPLGGGSRPSRLPSSPRRINTPLSCFTGSIVVLFRMNRLECWNELTGQQSLYTRPSLYFLLRSPTTDHGVGMHARQYRC